jgi:hypothetical protein
MGKPYLDIGDASTITRIDPSKEVEDYCTVNFYRRGWTSKSNNYKIDGDVFIDGKHSSVSMHGTWHEHVFISDKRNGEHQENLVWQKHPA